MRDFRQTIKSERLMKMGSNIMVLNWILICVMRSDAAQVIWVSFLCNVFLPLSLK